MSKYSTQVRFICENYAGLDESIGYSKVDEIIAKAIPKVFDFEFPIFDEAYRNVLCRKILRHYYTREIGAESVGLWKLWLNTRLNEIMPYYNKLYKSELFEFNPMYDVDYTRERKGKSDEVKTEQGESSNTGNVLRTGFGTGSGETTNSGTQYDYYSDTPQGGVGNLEDLTYLTNARKNTDSGTNVSNNEYSDHGETESAMTGATSLNSTINNTDEYLETVKGKQGGSSYAKMLEEYRATFMNIDVRIINELSDLFMNLW